MNAIVIALLFTLFHGAYTDGTPTDSSQTRFDQLRVKKAVQLALQQNPKINRIEEELQAAKAKRRTAVGISNPELIYYREGINDGDFAEETWRISQSFDFPTTSLFRSKQFSKELEAAEQRYYSEKLALISKVKQAYTDVAYQQEAEHLAKESVRLARQLQDAAQTRFQVGESAEMDVLNANIRLAQAENRHQKAVQQLMEARYELFTVIGLESEEQQYDIQFPDTLTYVEVSVDQQRVLNSLQEHPKLKYRDNQKSAADYNLKKAASSFAPDIRFDYYKQNLGAGAYDFTGFEVGFSVPLWFVFKQGPQVEQARAMQNNAAWQRKETLLTLKQNAEKAWHGYDSQNQNIRRHLETIQAQARKLLQQTQRGYQAGNVNLLQVLEAQRTYVQSQLSYYQNLRDYYHRLINLEQYLQEELVFITGEF